MRSVAQIFLISLPVMLNATAALAQLPPPDDVNVPVAVSSTPLPAGMMLAPGKSSPISTHSINTRVGARPTGELNLPVPDNSLWFRYYKAGEAASLKNNRKLAMQYWLASLGELEKAKPNPDDDLMSVKISALEQALTLSYPTDWSKSTQPAEERLKYQEHQVSTLLRMAQINRRMLPGDALLCTRSTERYSNAKRDYDKALAESKSKSNTAQ